MARKRSDRGHKSAKSLRVIASPEHDDAAPMLAEIDRRADELRQEAMNFVGSLTLRDPGLTSCEAFNEWAIQKLAGLQFLVEVLNGNLGALGAEVDRRRG